MLVKDSKAYAALSAEIAACETELRMLAGYLETQLSDHVRILLERRNLAFGILQKHRNEHVRLTVAGRRNGCRLSTLEDLISDQVRIVGGIDRDLRECGYDTSTLPK